MSAEEAAKLIKDGDAVGFSGFTHAGSPKVVPVALAEIAKAEHEAGRSFKIRVFTGASTGDRLDGELARAEAISFRAPYQTNKSLRALTNAGGVDFADLHLSMVAQELRYGFFGKINVAVVEACDVTEDGEIVVTSGVGNCPTFCSMADKIIIELNALVPKELRGFHDLIELKDPPYREPIMITKPSDRIGSDCIKVDPQKIVAVVKTEAPNDDSSFTPLDDVTKAIGENVARFLVQEIEAGRIPKEFLPVQSGVGNVANAVLGAMGASEKIPPFQVYTEVIQDSVINMIRKGKVKFSSGCSLSVSRDTIREFYKDLDFFRDKVVLRPAEISNNPEVIRRLGLIAINTALEADIYGNINSTHVTGTRMMNGIGGSGDFTRSAYISIFTTASTNKGDAISSFVPFVSHVDHTEHSVKIIISEYGIADLRNKSPRQRAQEIINNVVHPEYRPLLKEYLEIATKGQTAHNLDAAHEFHRELIRSGSMLNTDFSKFKK